jgi:hypothetical protein
VPRYVYIFFTLVPYRSAIVAVQLLTHRIPVRRSHTSTSVRSARRSSLAANASAAGAWLDQRGQQR